MDQKKVLKNLIKTKLINRISRSAIREIVNSDAQLKELWTFSFKMFPDFKSHFSIPVESEEVEDRIRLLIIYETLFVRNEIDDLIKNQNECNYADIGDSDGSVQMLLKKYGYDSKLTTTGVNLQQEAVKKIKDKGLNAICADALSLSDMGKSYDIISLFETLEHLSDPIGFLKKIITSVNHRLIISVPYIRKSRTGLSYLTHKWPDNKKPTIENTHIFELSPKDWKKLFQHTGWEICHEQKLLMYHTKRLSRVILQPFWRYVSFEGFWFVSLKKNNKYSSMYSIE